MNINRSNLTFFLMGRKYGFDLNRMVDFVNENQYWSKDRIYDHQLHDVKNIIEHAYKNVPYYRDKMIQMGMHPNDFKSLEDISHFPVISKQDIMADYSSFLSKTFTQHHPMERSTGGTTGVPFRYYIDIASWGLNWATKIRTFSWGGYKFGADQIAVLKGGSMVRKGNFSPKTYFWKYLHNYYTVPIINMTAASMDLHFSQIQKKKIRFIRGFPSALYVFAKHLDDKGILYPMRGVFTSAEMLYEYQRLMIEKVFGHFIIDAYGCGDGMAGANQCEEHHGYHVNIETSYMEILDKAGNPVAPGEEGNVVLTSLHDYAMPMIRYMPGDMAVPSRENCNCGRQLPLLDKIIGRAADLFFLPNGRILNGLSIPFEDWVDKIDRFQLIQERPDFVVLKIVPKMGFLHEDEKRIKELLLFNLGEGISVQIDVVDEIEQTNAGKFRYVISKVPR